MPWSRYIVLIWFMVIHPIMVIGNPYYGYVNPHWWCDGHEINMSIQIIFWLDSRMNSKVHNDTAPDSGGGVSAFETMVTEYLLTMAHFEHEKNQINIKWREKWWLTNGFESLPSGKQTLNIALCVSVLEDNHRTIWAIFHSYAKFTTR